MTALAMILAAAMAVPASGPEMESGETVQEPQRLNLRGEWEGTISTDGEPLSFRFSEGRVTAKFPELKGREASIQVSFTDEGRGKVRLRVTSDVLHEEGEKLGVYQQESDGTVKICVGQDHRPKSITPADGETLLILRRAKPRE